MNAYKILGVPIDADIDEIKQKYKEWMLHLHPDKGVHIDEDRRVEMMQNIKNAYDFFMSQTQVVNYPLDELDYNVDDDLKIHS